MPAPQGRPHARFEAQLSTLRSDEGGRHTPFVSGYRPQFYFRTTDVDGMLLLDSDSEMVLPGDTTAVTVELSKPVALNEGLGFAVREGRRTVAAGTIARLLG